MWYRTLILSLFLPCHYTLTESCPILFADIVLPFPSHTCNMFVHRQILVLLALMLPFLLLVASILTRVCTKSLAYTVNRARNSVRLWKGAWRSDYHTFFQVRRSTTCYTLFVVIRPRIPLVVYRRGLSQRILDLKRSRSFFGSFSLFLFLPISSFFSIFLSAVLHRSLTLFYSPYLAQEFVIF